MDDTKDMQEPKKDMARIPKTELHGRIVKNFGQ
jgi:hypothetical protein